MNKPPHSVDKPPNPSELSQVLGSLRAVIQLQADAANAAASREERREARDDRREERQAARDAKIEAKIDHLAADVESLKADNRRQDRVQNHDGAVAQEALTLAAAKSAGAEGGKARGGFWGGVVAAAVTTLGLVIVEYIRVGGDK